mmetsp:Transcript_46421/g.81684  ORF Transcript_46421/g.81684 Transcript_46421/m.81684 type:complete len:312 (+) Transcript_46421:193-1128(+)
MINSAIPRIRMPRSTSVIRCSMAATRLRFLPSPEVAGITGNPAGASSSACSQVQPGCTALCKAESTPPPMPSTAPAGHSGASANSSPMGRQHSPGPGQPIFWQFSSLPTAAVSPPAKSAHKFSPFLRSFSRLRDGRPSSIGSSGGKAGAAALETSCKLVVLCVISSITGGASASMSPFEGREGASLLPPMVTGGDGTVIMLSSRMTPADKLALGVFTPDFLCQCQYISIRPVLQVVLMMEKKSNAGPILSESSSTSSLNLPIASATAKIVAKISNTKLIKEPHVSTILVVASASSLDLPRFFKHSTQKLKA